MARPDAAPSASTPQRPEESANDPVAELFARLGWMVFGHLAIVAIAVTILLQPAWELSVRDALFWAVVGLTIWVRRIDVVRFRGQTAYGTPATPRDLRRYAAGLAASALAAWLCAQSFGAGG